MCLEVCIGLGYGRLSGSTCVYQMRGIWEMEGSGVNSAAEMAIGA